MTQRSRWMAALVAVSVFTVGAAAEKDFRVANFGDDCSLLAKREEALGSKGVPSPLAIPGEMFQGREFGLPVDVFYECGFKRGKVGGGIYFFHPKPKGRAMEDFLVVYQAMIAKYGRPTRDDTPWKFGERVNDPLAIEGTSDGFRADWQRDRTHVIAQFQSRGPNDEDWSVHVHVSGKDR